MRSGWPKGATAASVALAISILMLAGLGTSADVSLTARAAVERSLPLLQSSAHTWFEKRQCASCHHQGLGITAVVLARERGFHVDQSLLDEQVARTTPPRSWRDRYLLGEVSINEQIGESYRAVARRIAGAPNGALTNLQIYMLSGKQHVAGHWNSYSHRPPLEDSEFTATAMTIRALRVLQPDRQDPEIARRIDRARQWLASAPPGSSEERAMQLFGLRWAGAGARDIEAARDRILKDQRKDGGWAQIDTRGSDAYATGQALVALNQAAGVPVTARAYRRGVNFLLHSQREDGTWLVETRRTRSEGLEYFETGFPHGKHQFISYAATAWATMALTLSLDGSPARPIVGTPAGTSSPDSWAADADADPLSPLMTAALHGSVTDLDKLIAEGADVNATTKSGITALMCAVSHPAATARLLRAGADANARAASGHTALVLAAGYDGAEESVRQLLDRGANANAIVTQGIIPAATPVTRAAMRGDVATAKLLLEHGASLDSTAGPQRIPVALFISVFQGDSKMVDFLLSQGAAADARLDLEDIGFASTTPLMAAAEAGFPDLVRLLLKRGADSNAQDKAGLTPLMYAAAAIDRGNTQIIEALIASGARTSAQSAHAETALSFAQQYGNQRAAALLSKP
jgi:ankyrin repeat protein